MSNIGGHLKNVLVYNQIGFPGCNLSVQEMQVQTLSGKDSQEKEMATHSSILAWRIPLTEEPGCYSPWGHKESDTI